MCSINAQWASPDHNLFRQHVLWRSRLRPLQRTQIAIKSSRTCWVSEMFCCANLSANQLFSHSFLIKSKAIFFLLLLRQFRSVKRRFIDSADISVFSFWCRLTSRELHLARSHWPRTIKIGHRCEIREWSWQTIKRLTTKTNPKKSQKTSLGNTLRSLLLHPLRGYWSLKWNSN